MDSPTTRHRRRVGGVSRMPIVLSIVLCVIVSPLLSVAEARHRDAVAESTKQQQQQQKDLLQQQQASAAPPTPTQTQQRQQPSMAAHGADGKCCGVMRTGMVFNLKSTKIRLVHWDTELKTDTHTHKR